MSAAQQAVDLARSRPATLGSGRLLCVDGPAGSGKSTLAAEVAGLTGAPVVRMDDLYPGWTGLFEVAEHVLGLLAPLAEGLAGRYRRYDWATGRYAEEHVVEPSELLVLEGVGSGHRDWSRWTTGLVWVEADDEIRLARGMARDGEAVRPQWLAWMADESRLFAEHEIRERADLRVAT